MPDTTENLTEPSAIIRELIEAGATLEMLGHYDESIAAYTEVDTRFGSETDPEVADLVAIAVIRKGQLLSRLRRREESTAVFDDVVSRYQAEEDPRFRIRVATALFHTGIDLAMLNRTCRKQSPLTVSSSTGTRVTKASSFGWRLRARC